MKPSSPGFFASAILAAGLTIDSVAEKMKDLSGGLIDVSGESDDLAEDIKKLTSEINTVEVGVDDTTNALNKLSEGFTSLKEEGNLLQGELSGLNGEFLKLAQEAGLTFDPEISGFSGVISPEVEEQLQNIKDQIAENEKLKTAIDNRNESLANAKNAVENLVTPQEELNQLQDDLTLAFQLGC